MDAFRGLDDIHPHDLHVMEGLMSIGRELEKDQRVWPAGAGRILPDEGSLGPPDPLGVTNVSALISSTGYAPQQHQSPMRSPVREPSPPRHTYREPMEEENIHDRLYRHGMMDKKRGESPARKSSAKKSSQKPSAQKRRRKTLWDISADEKRRDLYIDAECRRRMLQEKIQQKHREAAARSSRPSIAPASQALARRRKEKDFRQVFEHHASHEGDRTLPLEVRAAGKMSYVGLRAALVELGVASPQDDDTDQRLADKAWSAMCSSLPPAADTTYIHFPAFCDVVLSMLDGSPRSRGLSIPAAARVRSKSRGGGGGGGGGRALSPVLASRDTNVQLQGAKRQSVISRQLAEATKKQNGVSADEYKCSFNPAINENSRKMVQTHENDLPRFLALHSAQEREMRLDEQRRNKEEELMNKCTFQPSINKMSTRMKRPESDAPLCSVPPQRKELKTHERHEELELQECTFEPKTNTYKRVKDRPLPNGYFECIKRLRDGKYDKPRSFEENLRGGAPPSVPGSYQTRHSVRTTTKVRPFNLRLARRNAPLMYLDVQLPKGKKGRIGIHEGDTAAGLARSFASSYQLDEKTEANLLKVLASHIDTLVPKLLAEAADQVPPEVREEAQRVATEFAASAAMIETLNGEAEVAEVSDALDEAFDENIEIGDAIDLSNDFNEAEMTSADREYFNAIIGDDYKARLRADVSDYNSVPAPIHHPHMSPARTEKQGGGDNLFSPIHESFIDPNESGVDALMAEINAMEQQYGIR